MADSIFTKIIKGEIPSYKIYEDEKTFAFLDIHPIQPGHMLVVPKNQVSEFQELPDEDYQALFKTVKKLAKHLKKVTKAERVCSRIEGFDVPHTHIHLYPCNEAKEFYGSLDRNQREPDNEALAAMVKKLQIN
jgi:histidine triad (HIT) family protein